MRDSAKLRAWRKADYAKNPAKYAARSAKWRAKPGSKAWMRAYNAQYTKDCRAVGRIKRGLPLPTRPEPVACELCARIPAKSLHLDHDHTTGDFRGWLCMDCNTGLGKLGDSAAGLLRALAYLTK